MEPVTFVSVGIGLAGMLFHFWKKKIRNQTLDSLKNYVVGHPVYTVMATAATVAACIAAAPDQMADLYNASTVGMLFSFGFGCDSLINKAVNES